MPEQFLQRLRFLPVVEMTKKPRVCEKTLKLRYSAPGVIPGIARTLETRAVSPALKISPGGRNDSNHKRLRDNAEVILFSAMSFRAERGILCLSSFSSA